MKIYQQVLLLFFLCTLSTYCLGRDREDDDYWIDKYLSVSFPL